VDPRQLFSDERFNGYCVYCGGEDETGDHVPSKVLLDGPYFSCGTWSGGMYENCTRIGRYPTQNGVKCRLCGVGGQVRRALKNTLNCRGNSTFDSVVRDGDTPD
jgi:hypothetical protein